jgi:predicted phage terminase large subunit-like protein
MIGAIQWEDMSPDERAVLRAAGETSPLAFMSLWFNVAQGEPMQVNWHHHYFDWAVRQMLDGTAQNVVINTPPGSTKTEFFSVHLPAYTVAKYDKIRILNTSYSKDLVNENSDRTRHLIKSAEFQECYPYEAGSDKVDNWTLNKNGKRTHQLFSRSSGGQIMGVRGGFISPGKYTGHIQADDWDKPDDMFSEIKRKRGHTRLVNTLRSRRGYYGTPLLCIQQRLHVEDVTAFLLKGKEGGAGLEVHLHIKIPVLVDQDFIDTLPDGIRERCIKDVCHTEQIDGYWSYWPDKESVQDMIALREANPYTFASQYMQDPATLSGGIFNADDFLFYGDPEVADLELPKVFEQRFITADTAQKTNNWNDWTVFAEWGVAEGKLWRLRLERDRMDAKALRQRFEAFVNACHADNCGTRGALRHVLVEDKSSGTGLIQELDGRLPVPITAVPRDKDKLTRALDVQPHHAAKKVVLPYGDPSNYEFVSEVAGFTADDSHRFDDQTDVMIDAIHHQFVAPYVGPKHSAGVW